MSINKSRGRTIIGSVSNRGRYLSIGIGSDRGVKYLAYRYTDTSLENARSSSEWIGPVQYCKLIEDRRSSTDPVLTFETLQEKPRGGRGRCLQSDSCHKADKVTTIDGQPPGPGVLLTANYTCFLLAWRLTDHPACDC